MKNIIAVIVVLSIIAGCSGKTGPYEGYYYGITSTDENGAYTGLYDENDWKDAAGLSGVKIYPNPYFRAESDLALEYIADAAYDHIEIRFESYPGFTNLRLDYHWTMPVTEDSVVIEKGEFGELDSGYYRMYVTINDAVVYGDILIK
ncbi:MAG TPA: hypothetical protein ENN55_05720 [Firmicutes bacterium]|nr:hypothetical protein [Bacillota bacterium]